jgi:hypothetical protein
MQNPGYNTGNIIFSEGEWFPFRIHNLVQLQDDSWYYVLQDINGMKHFMPSEYYKSYGFVVGEEIKCKIDRINCTGRIFLEPEHPYYKEGNSYYFDVINCSDSVMDSSMMVRENSGNIIEVPVNGIKKIDMNDLKRVRCIVNSIIKGSLNLEIHPDCT